MPASSDRPPSTATGQAPSNLDPGSRGRTGLWLVGARGAISTCVAYGIAGIRHDLIPSVGLPSAYPPLSGLDLVSLDDFVLGGHDVCTRDLSASAGELVAAGILPADLVSMVRDDAARFEAAIRPGILDVAETGFRDLDPRAAALGSLAPAEQSAAIEADLVAFREEHDLDRVVVVYLASTEAAVARQEAWNSGPEFEKAVAAGVPQPASLLYAYAAIRTGSPFVNFTPSIGANVPALMEMAATLGVPIAGNDGKTGETLVKTALAPMFRARALQVLAWQGYNMLGNRDGEVLRNPSHKAAKLESKDAALRSILGGATGATDGPHTQVSIDYVPSLGDWKTAWDFIHFEGFLGAKMSMQFTWSGCDSALAAPLVIDLARFADLAARSGESGALTHLGCYFKSPLQSREHDFHRQMEALYAYAQKHTAR
ncbi:Inositol-3-phosphate synthase [Planctomycetes bacterium Poly30]|uniref:Inositol-3-phosphate synthase n=2 Tax=Saltatorellus ferox TaxID=2528018 RepID=A0A518EXC2_9BACT|nr:Inositol-3-phosphate synthase [Planctomycetes bacterium Poly30]